MTDAEIKLKLFRFIDNQQGHHLQEIYEILKKKFDIVKKSRRKKFSSLEEQYKLMSQDNAREKDALEWIEGTLNTDEL